MFLVQTLLGVGKWTGHSLLKYIKIFFQRTLSLKIKIKKFFQKNFKKKFLESSQSFNLCFLPIREFLQNKYSIFVSK